MRLAVRASVVGCSFLGASCLVTEKVDYPVVNSPPTITRMEPSVLTTIPTSSPLACPQGTRKFISLELDVRDDDVEDVLKGVIVVNNEQQVPVPELNKTLPTTGVPERTPLTLCVPADPNKFTRPCNLLEVRISRDFDTSPIPQPNDPQDLARRQLLVLASIDDNPAASSEDCDALLNELGGSVESPQ